ncbi:MAG TPA: group 1 truncated hemoglobin [Gemmataceae bacterium]|jgi:truncated hemoglobin YjbI
MRNPWGPAAVLAVALIAAPLAAQDTAAIDRLLADGLKDMHNKAADLYNAGDPNGCYQMFRGGLYTARPLLAHRPDVQQLIDQGLQAAERQASIALRAKQLHETIEAIRTKLKPPTAAKPADPVTPPANPLPTSPTPVGTPAPSTPPPMPPGPSLPMTGGTSPPPAPPAPAAGDTLWKRLGGDDGVTKIVDDWLTWAFIDPKVNFTRGDKFKFDKQKEADLKQKFVGYISSIADGTVVPTTSRSLADAHKGMGITGAEFDAFVGLLKTALEKNNVAARDVDELLRRVNATKKDLVGG